MNAPGHPGIEPSWTSSAKTGVGTATTLGSRVWFTLSHGIVNEVYYPTVDQANIRDLGLIVTNGAGFFSEEKRDTTHEVLPVAQAIPAFHLINRCIQGRYEIQKTVLTHPTRDALLQRITFRALSGTAGDYRVHALLAPHIGNRGRGNTGWAGEYKGVPMLFAERDGTALAMACSVPFPHLSCGYVGTSDGWQQLRTEGRLTPTYERAEDGNIALTGEIDLAAAGGTAILAVGFGRHPEEAAVEAHAAILDNFGTVLDAYADGWQQAQQGLLPLRPVTQGGIDVYRLSTSVIRVHDAKRPAGARVASLSVPWGSSKSDDDMGGYHLVWPRDLVQSAMGLLAAGDHAAARETLLYLESVQEPDGHWDQNLWLDGRPYWSGIQMDETALPILLADALASEHALDGLDVWPMVRSAASFLVRNGPVTGQDRWEEDGGYSPFTLATEIAALIAAADFADRAEEPGIARYLREVGDAWNDSVERWTYLRDTKLAREVGVAGYYVRVAPSETADAASPVHGFVPIKNRPPGESRSPTEEIVSPDALALVRFGLRRADDPRIENTVRVIDHLLRIETSRGPGWRRYPGDGYGEHETGAPFDGTGVGRCWPLLAGERGHYELANANSAEAARLLETMARQSSDGGLLPEQIWDADDLEERELFNGRPSGSAMPLVWAHAEFVQLCRSLHDGQVFGQPAAAVSRYALGDTHSNILLWTTSNRCRSMPAGRVLRVEAPDAATIHWSTNRWQRTQDQELLPSGLGTYYADLGTAQLAPGEVVRFTLRWTSTGQWIGEDFKVRIT